MRALAVAVAVVSLVVAGCGSEDEGVPPRAALAADLGALCDRTRVAVEALGEPKDEGARVFKPWARIGHRFVADVRRLPATTALQRRRLGSLADYYAGFYDALAYSYEISESGQSMQRELIKTTLERGYAQLASGETMAKRLGAVECAVRPFDDD